ncbi:hypothetical protein EDF56_103329 [Novosphingobium sp. PhB165]|uniref:nucleotide synthetase n=1 Tax=Novosphingobium sp. PhB165 TaxID=2485105 RepID=UPI00104FA55F|nr:nucleotide synthetase [Novosphingobium sp. PhB165]TCM19686.1 hypothetical protein EDF56_103329 [Novosphingobium sp. PhB165]
MSTQNYTEFGLSPWLEPDVQAENWGAEAPIYFYVSLKAKHDRIALKYHVKDAPEDQDYIAITTNSTVQITLEGEQLWFSKAYEGITTKDPLSSYYGGVEYVDYDKRLDRYKSLRFKARYNVGGKLGTCHGFNLNVDLLQWGDDGEPKWISLSIDPDIKNPPPQNGG